MTTDRNPLKTLKILVYVLNIISLGALIYDYFILYILTNFVLKKISLQLYVCNIHSLDLSNRFDFIILSNFYMENKYDTD